MSCKPVCKLCNRLVISQAVTFSGGNLIINIPAGAYNDGEKYCIVVAQTIPSTTTINAPVVITIGTGTVQYPLTKSNCAQVTACGIRTRTRYSVCVSTTATGGNFKMLGSPCCSPSNNLRSIKVYSQLKIFGKIFQNFDKIIGRHKSPLIIKPTYQVNILLFQLFLQQLKLLAI